MPKLCVVPNCKTGRKGKKLKRSIFHVPKDPDLLKKWIAAIPGKVNLQPSHYVCEEHFNDDLIIRGWVKTDWDGNVIMKGAYKCPQLSKIAVPTKFNEDMEEEAVSASCQLLPSVIQKLEIQNSHSSASGSNNAESSHIVDSSTATIPLSAVESCNDEDIADNEDPAVHGDKVHLVPKVMDCGLPLSTRDSYIISLAAVTFSQREYSFV